VAVGADDPGAVVMSFDLPGGESTAAALRRAEQWRDEAWDVANRNRVELAKVYAELASVRAELESARQELEQLRARPWIVARDAGYPCEQCDRIIRRGEAYEYLGADLYQHVHCPEAGAT
jgi:hypothetical protein